ncbi:MAG: PAS domain S-box protein [Akkermansiaceae bacterium]|nr:PAS domain S-box protein [Armatimonadota bacterium]
MDTNLSGELLRDLNEKLLMASVRQHELTEIAKQAEQRLSAMVNGLHAVICEINVQTGEMSFISEQAESLLGYERSAWNQRGFWRRVIHPEDRAAALAYLFEAVRSLHNLEHEFRVVAQDGRIVWVRNRAVVVYGADNAEGLMRCVLEDVLGRKQAEAMLAQSECRYLRLFAATQEGILLLDAKTGVIIDASPSATALFGFSHGTLSGKEFFEIGLFAGKQECRDAFARLQREHFVHFDSLPLYSPTGAVRAVELTGNAYDESVGTVIQCRTRDVTERKRAETLQTEDPHRDRQNTAPLQRPLQTDFCDDASWAALFREESFDQNVL